MRRSLLLATLLLAAAPLQAQRAPNITAPKQAAQRAANAVNAKTARTEAVTATPAPAQGTARRPAATPTASGTKAAAGAAAGAAVATAATRQASATPAKGGTPATGNTSVAARGEGAEVVFQRETFAYPGSARRDPFASLMKSGDLRPLLSDLRLVTVLYDPTGRNSVAILRDLGTKDQYRVKTGQQLGRMRVAQIQPRQVVFTIEEFGYSRQETLGLADPTSERTQ